MKIRLSKVEEVNKWQATVAASSYSVKLCWVPGYSGIEGNEHADSLAKEGAKSFIGPDFMRGTSLPKSTIGKDRKKLSSGIEWKAKWFIHYNSEPTGKFLNLQRGDLRFLTSAFTGHCRLKYNLHSMGLAQNATCRLCKDEDETAEHILCEYEAACRQRLRHLSFWTLSPSKVYAAEVVRFLRGAIPDWS